MRLKISFFILFTAIVSRCGAQIAPLISNGLTSIFRPINENDSAISKTISIYNQQIKVDVYDGYVVMGADYWFNNSSDHAITLDIGFPQNGNEGFVSKFYWLRIRINNGAPFLANDTSITNGDSAFGSQQHALWNHWKISFQPGITEVSLNYGLKTGGNYVLMDDDSIERNAFEYSFLNYAEWSGGDTTGEIWLRMND